MISPLLLKDIKEWIARADDVASQMQEGAIGGQEAEDMFEEARTLLARTTLET